MLHIHKALASPLRLLDFIRPTGLPPLPGKVTRPNLVAFIKPRIIGQTAALLLLILKDPTPISMTDSKICATAYQLPTKYLHTMRSRVLAKEAHLQICKRTVL
jgi:hypothetical protein